jgi:uncharacterized protein involved in cysteine biosynthesis
LPVGFVRGFLAPFRGGLFIARQRMWRYLFVPLLVNVALAVGTLWMAALYWRQELATHLASSPVVGWILLAAITLVGGAVLFIVLQPLLGAIFNDHLSAKVEQKVRGTAPSAPFLASSGQALLHGLLKLVLYGTALLIGLALTALTGVGSLIGIGLGGLFLAYDGFDYPLSRRGRSFGAKWAYLIKHPAQTVGYGLGATVLYLIPLAFIVAPPFATAGATLAFLDADAKATARAERRAAKLAKAAKTSANPSLSGDGKQAAGSP